MSYFSEVINKAFSDCVYMSADFHRLPMGVQTEFWKTERKLAEADGKGKDLDELIKNVGYERKSIQNKLDIGMYAEKKRVEKLIHSKISEVDEKKEEPDKKEDKVKTKKEHKV